MEIEINSNDHKISNNKLRYYFNDITKFGNNRELDLIQRNYQII